MRSVIIARPSSPGPIPTKLSRQRATAGRPIGSSVWDGVQVAFSFRQQAGRKEDCPCPPFDRTRIIACHVPEEKRGHSRIRGGFLLGGEASHPPPSPPGGSARAWTIALRGPRRSADAPPQHFSAATCGGLRLAVKQVRSPPTDRRTSFREDRSSSVLCTRAALRRPSVWLVMQHNEGYFRLADRGMSPGRSAGLAQPRRSGFR